MGDRLWAGKPSRYVTATEVDSAFYPMWDGKALSTLATIVAEFGDCHLFGDCRRFGDRRWTVAEFGDKKLSPFPATIVASVDTGQGLK